MNYFWKFSPKETKREGWLTLCLSVLLMVVTLHFMLHPASVTAQNDPAISSLLNEAGENYDRGDEEEALQIYLEILNRRPNNYEALWNASLLHTRKGQIQPTPEQERIYYEIARDYARLCLDIHPEKARSHYVYGIASASIADNMSNSQKRVELVWKIKDHADRAAHMDPDYAPIWHLLGVWHSNLANISRTERFAARFLYGKLPDGASLEKAEEYLKKAIRMEPNELLFYLDLGQHYQETGQNDLAISVFQTLETMDPKSANDTHYLQETRERLQHLR